jgi:hypothetical protein
LECGGLQPLYYSTKEPLLNGMKSGVKPPHSKINQ